MPICQFGSRPRLVTTSITGLLLLLVSSWALAGGGTFSGPIPYLSRANSPFLAGINAGTVHLETFECGNVQVPGVRIEGGIIIGPGGLTDSVDADDGAIDGSGTNGRSVFGSGTPGITFIFDAPTLGALPTQVGIVWTDGSGTTSFEAFDSMGASLGTFGPVAIADGSFGGTTAEDNFFGVSFPGGISSIRISNTAGGIEVDHLQFGSFAGATITPCGVGVPTPTVTATATPTTVAATATATATPTTVAPTATQTPQLIASPAVPTLSFPMLALLALGLAGAAILLIRGT
ncbi:MAG TPA: hypothetical protein VNC59_08980 [Thermoanaerobaculia bacterium]|nr:hypothetical protein [Thermoanaerobaculia bacterium]